MRIGELASVTKVSVRSLRYYEEQGLLSAERSSSGQRHYETAAPERVALIQQLFAAGLCSATMAELLPCMAEPSTRTPALAARLREERERIGRNILNLQQTQQALDRVITEIG